MKLCTYMFSEGKQTFWPAIMHKDSRSRTSLLLSAFSRALLMSTSSSLALQRSVSVYSYAINAIFKGLLPPERFVVAASKR